MNSLYEIYQNEYCYYCYQYTEQKDRTTDHVIPLSKNGPHTLDDIVMACANCNHRKYTMSEEDFRFWKLLQS